MGKLKTKTVAATETENIYELLLLVSSFLVLFLQIIIEFGEVKSA